MAYVQGEKGAYIKELMEKSNEEWDNGDLEKSVTLLEQAWDELPDEKVQYNESFLMIRDILHVSIQLGDKARMSKWVDKIFVTDLGRGDTGERDLWAGKVAYELGEFEKARELLETANKKSGGRSFGPKDGKYLKFIKTK